MVGAGGGDRRSVTKLSSGEPTARRKEGGDLRVRRLSPRSGCICRELRALAVRFLYVRQVGSEGHDGIVGADAPSGRINRTARTGTPDGCHVGVRTLLFFQDLLTHGVQQPGGLIDRCGRRWIGFDIDGTRETKRNRAVVQNEAYPTLHRRGEPGRTARGYTSRKRGEEVRTRTQGGAGAQAHTQEQLGTFGHAGNGDRLAELQRSAEAIQAYMAVRGGDARAFGRIDGGYGRPSDVLRLKPPAVCFITRATTPSLLKHPSVVAALADTPDDRFEQPDTGTVREVFDIGFLDWATVKEPDVIVNVRVIVTRRTLKAGEKVTVGYQVGNQLFELFVTDLYAEGFLACDVLDLYFCRGAFEGMLGQEDRELYTDRWVSGHPQTQELFQIIAQWAWNKRIVLGLARQPMPLRRTVFSKAAVELGEVDVQRQNQVPREAEGVTDLVVHHELPPAPVLQPEIVPSLDGPRSTPTEAQDQCACTMPVQAFDAQIGVTVPVEPPEIVPSLDVLQSTPTEAQEQCPCTIPVQALDAQLGVIAPVESPSDVDTASAVHPAISQRRRLTVEPQCIDPSAMSRGGRWGMFGACAFVLLPDGTLLCPNDKVLRPIELRSGSKVETVRYSAKVADCRGCSKLAQCMGAAPSAHGRRIDLPLRPSSTTMDSPSHLSVPVAVAPPLPSLAICARPPPCGPFPIVWEDFPSASLRRTLIAQLRNQRVDVEFGKLQDTPCSDLISRDRRAHRRFSWSERMQRNACPTGCIPEYRVYGVSKSLAAHLGGAIQSAN